MPRRPLMYDVVEIVPASPRGVHVMVSNGSGAEQWTVFFNTRHSLKNVIATAPHSVKLWFTRRGKKWIASLYPLTQKRWEARLKTITKPVRQLTLWENND